MYKRQIPSKVLEGEVWRLITFVFSPPFSGAGIGLLFTFFALYIFWLTGSAVEDHLGALRYNLYVLISLVVPVLLAIVASLVPGQAEQAVSNTAVITCAFLGFAYLFPDYTFLLFFVLPVKVKYLAWITYAFLAIGTAASLGAGDWFSALMIASTPTGFLAFFGQEIVARLRGSHRAIKRKSEAIKEQGQAFHTCSICGKTDKTHPELHFYYTQGENGTACYCEEHAPSKQTKS